MQTNSRTSVIAAIHATSVIEATRAAATRYYEEHVANGSQPPGQESFMRKLEAETPVDQSPFAALRRRHPLPNLVRSRRFGKR